jgi:hypothetical protein
MTQSPAGCRVGWTLGRPYHTATVEPRRRHDGNPMGKEEQKCEWTTATHR